MARAPAKEPALVQFLIDVFQPDELRRWVALELGDSVANSLPGSHVSMAELAFQTVIACKQRGLIDGAFFASLQAERDAFADRIRELARLWGSRPNPA